MSASGLKELEFMDETVRAVKYQAILQNNLLPGIGKLCGIDNDFIFQQDVFHAILRVQRRSGLRNII